MSLARCQLTTYLRPAFYNSVRAASTSSKSTSSSGSDPTDVARGLNKCSTLAMMFMRLTGVTKGALHNPNVSDEAKKADRTKLRELKKSGELDDAEAHLKSVERGYKVCQEI